jgi:hypothetical protein
MPGCPHAAALGWFQNQNQNCTLPPSPVSLRLENELHTDPSVAVNCCDECATSEGRCPVSLHEFKAASTCQPCGHAAASHRFKPATLTRKSRRRHSSQENGEARAEPSQLFEISGTGQCTGGFIQSHQRAAYVVYVCVRESCGWMCCTCVCERAADASDVCVRENCGCVVRVCSRELRMCWCVYVFERAAGVSYVCVRESGICARVCSRELCVCVVRVCSR